ncbi:23S rRNA (adenine(2503)-C(2))-methyltransferase RlmN [candidate division KSB1 bacterium]|nr:MAG: 23S rRNA (adenine(2503)-C(2))-methyltransferase RlmN [candidate division KSB1 bacterium]
MMTMGQVSLKGLSKAELEEFAVSLGWEPYRGRQLFRWLYQKNVASFIEMTSFRKEIRAHLEQSANLHQVFLVSQHQSYHDDTIKFLFALPDGLQIESVFIPEDTRKTVCVSTQVGCALGCRFCATGRMSFKRNLQPGEIIDQVLQIKRILNCEVTNVVMMGMGEPLLNYDHVIKAAYLLSDPEGVAIGKRKITISTCGIVPAIYRYTDEGHRFGLAVSLNATTDTIRSQLMPINKKYPIAKLMEAVRYYVNKVRRRVTFEYVMIHGVNDTREDAQRLKRLLGGLKCKVNLIPLNPINKNWNPPDEIRLNYFIQELSDLAAPITVRRSKGEDIQAACGQLYAKNLISL